MAIVNPTLTIPSNKVLTEGYDPAFPLVGKITGTVTDGQSIVISGENFGSGPTIANIVYDEFDGGVAGQDVNTTATVGSWTSVSDGDFTPDYVNDLYGSLLSCDHIKADAGAWLDKTFPSTITEFFISYAVKVPDGSYFPFAGAEETFSTGSNWKLTWLLGATGTPDNDLCIPTYSSTNIFTVTGNDVGFFSKILENGTPLNMWQWDAWTQYKCWLKGDPTNPDTVAGNFWFQAVREGLATQKIVTDNTFSFANGTVPYSWTRMRFNGWHRTGGGANVNVHLACPYIAWGAGACSRIEIGDAATYTGCTRLAICTPTAWVDGEITLTVRKGSHASLTGKYLYIVDRSNVVNNIGYPL